MKVKFWGTRGSIAAPGPETTKYGGNTSCVEITLANGELIILDAGTGIRKLGIELSNKHTPTRATFLITHAHWDHIEGFPFFEPAYDTGSEFTVYGCNRSYKQIKSIFRNMMEGTFFPVLFEELKATFDFRDFCRGSFELGKTRMSILPTNHPGDTQSYKLVENGITVIYMTDNDPFSPTYNKTSFSKMVDFCADADLLIHDAMFTKEEWELRKTWGHSSVDAAVELGVKSGVKRLLLFHHDPERTDEQVDRMLQHARELCGGDNSVTKCYAAQEGMEFDLTN